MKWKQWLGMTACLGVWTAQAAPEVYAVEPNHTFPSFKVSHMEISYWRGKFDHTSGRIWLDRARRTGRVDITVDLTSINFGMPLLDNVTQDSAFFKAAQYPTATFKADTIVFKDGSPASIPGRLTMAGVTRPVTLQVVSFKCMQHPMLGREICGADVRARFDRREFGMNRDIVAADPDVWLYIQVEAIRGDMLPRLGPSAGAAAGSAAREQQP